MSVETQNFTFRIKPVWFETRNFLMRLRVLKVKKHPKTTSAYEKYEYGRLGRWYIKLTLFKYF